ncbi:MAG: energy-coupling factor transporter transmembrane component T [Chloroflexota bacterium]
MKKLHSTVWLSWLVVVILTVGFTRNPFYLVLLWMSIAVVNVATRSAESTVWNSSWTLWASLGILPMSALFNALTTHFGSHVLFTIPGQIPLLSGIVTLEALVYGLTNGLVLSVIINVFWTFNRNVPVRALLRLIPRAFYSLAVVSSIAVTFVPLTLRQYQQIQEAQAVRGHRLRGVRDLLPLLMPLLIGSLERAFQLAEVLTARGFHQPGFSVSSVMASRGMMAGGLICFFVGWQAGLFFQNSTILPAMTTGFFLAGATLFLLPFWQGGKKRNHTRYQSESWGWRDIVGLGGLILLTAAVYLLRSRVEVSLAYTPYPALSMPHFDSRMGILIMGLCFPALLQGAGEHD